MKARAPRNRVLRWAIIALVGAFVGWAGNRVGVPLSWILGPLIVSGAAALAGVGGADSNKLRRASQVVIGTAIGHSFSAATLAALLPLIPAMVALAVWSVLVAAVFSLLLTRWAGLDRTSALLANLPGGVAEMAFIADDMGKSTSSAISVIQTLRVTSMVMIVPSVLALFTGASGTGATLGRGGHATIGVGTVVVLAAGLGVGWVFQRIGLKNAFIIGALVVSVTDTATGLLQATVPGLLVIAAQISLGLSLGARFRRDDISRLPKVACAGLAVSLATSATIMSSALLVALMAGVDPRSVALAAAPAGMAEMVLTAGALGLSVPLVACFQIVRILVVNAFAGPVAAGWTRLGELSHRSG